MKIAHGAQHQQGDPGRVGDRIEHVAERDQCEHARAPPRHERHPEYAEYERNEDERIEEHAAPYDYLAEPRRVDVSAAVVEMHEVAEQDVPGLDVLEDIAWNE